MEARNSFSCCGAVEIAGVSSFCADTADSIFSTVEYITDEDGNDTDPLHCFAAIIFTDATNFYSFKGGENLARWIRSKRFGAVVSSRPVINRNSGNPIKVWVWTPNAAGKNYLIDRHKA